MGERVDAHRFIPDVMEKGCLATLSERLQEGADYAYIQIESSLQAVKDIAEFYLEQLQIPVVGITGSVGKQVQRSYCLCSEGKVQNIENPGEF